MGVVAPGEKKKKKRRRRRRRKKSSTVRRTMSKKTVNIFFIILFFRLGTFECLPLYTGFNKFSTKRNLKFQFKFVIRI